MAVKGSQGVCWECDDPVWVDVMGWYRCRSCGYESLRSSLFEFLPVRPALACGAAACDAPDAGLVSFINNCNGVAE